MNQEAPRQARIYRTLRTAHLERQADARSVDVIYATRNYDFDQRLAAELPLMQASRPMELVAALFRGRYTTVEVNEPLFRGAVRYTAVAVVACRALGFARGSQPRIVTYAIENRAQIAQDRVRGPKRRLGLTLDRLLTRVVASQVDRIAFGTSVARDTYSMTLGKVLTAPEQKVIPALPSPCACPPQDRDPHGVLFLGALHQRKGFPLVVAAWTTIKQKDPLAHLTVVGKGPLSGVAESLAASDESVDVVIDPPRDAVHAALRNASVLILLSQPWPAWREQVGLPIVEGLAHGCRIVTTTETGLASWLSDHGHAVLDPATDPAQVGCVVAQFLGGEDHAASVAAALPDMDGRTEAEFWLFRE